MNRAHDEKYNGDLYQGQDEVSKTKFIRKFIRREGIHQMLVDQEIGEFEIDGKKYLKLITEDDTIKILHLGLEVIDICPNLTMNIKHIQHTANMVGYE